MYIAGVIGMELVGGRYAKLYGTLNFTYSMLATVEESLEMAGLIVFIWGLLLYIGDSYNEIQLSFYSFEKKSSVIKNKAQRDTN